MSIQPKIKCYLIVLFILANFTTFGQRIGYNWINIIDSSKEPISIVDKEDNLIVKSSGKITKFDLDGNLIWEINDTLYNTTGITVDSKNNYYITGKTSKLVSDGPPFYTEISYIYIAKYNYQGKKIWVTKSEIQKIQNSRGNFSTSIACDIFDGIYLTGSFKSSISFDGIKQSDPNYSAIFIAKFDTTGNIHWIKKMFGTNSGDLLTYGQGNEIIVDQENNIYVTGSYRGPFNFGGSIVACHGLRDVFLSKLDANGNFLFTKTFGGNESDEGVRLSVDENNNHIMLIKFGGEIIINGIHYQAIDNYNNALIIKFVNDSIDFATQIGKSHGGLILSDICVDQNNNIIYVGSIANESTSHPVVYRISTTGEIDWHYKTAESTKTNFASNNSLVTDSYGGIYLAGIFNYTAYFGDTLLEILNDKPQVFIGMIDSTLKTKVIANSYSDMKILMYPTITNGGLTITSESLKLDNSSLYLINIEGQIVKQFILRGNNSEIHFDNLNPGIFFVKIISDDFIANSKIIKY